MIHHHMAHHMSHRHHPNHPSVKFLHIIIQSPSFDPLHMYGSHHVSLLLVSSIVCVGYHHESSIIYPLDICHTINIPPFPSSSSSYPDHSNDCTNQCLIPYPFPHPILIIIPNEPQCQPMSQCASSQVIISSILTPYHVMVCVMHHTSSHHLHLLSIHSFMCVSDNH